jgi:hypothetical protein
MMTETPLSAWVVANLTLLRVRHPDLDERVDGGVQWVRIPAVAVSSIWTVDHVDVAFRIPNGAGEAPYGFWVHPGLALRSKATVNNYTFPAAAPWGPDWGQFSFAPEGAWMPKADVASGDNMLDYDRGIVARLEEGA